MINQTASSQSQTRSQTGDGAVICLAVTKASARDFPIYWLKLPPEKGADDTWVQGELLPAVKEVLVDPLLEDLWAASPQEREGWLKSWGEEGVSHLAEKQFAPGVTDNLAHTVREALALKGLDGIELASGHAYLLEDSGASVQSIEEKSRYTLYHPLVERFRVHDLTSPAAEQAQHMLQFPAVHLPPPEPPAEVDLELTDEELVTLSRERLLALTLDEMKAIRQHYRQAAVVKKRAEAGMPANPTDVELEVIAQTWSEHCKHKIFNATINHSGRSKEEQLQVRSLYKTYIQGATNKLRKKRPDLLSVFEDNAGVVRWSDDWAVCFKVETHNSPSALEPYGGALTGILGVNRDILGTGIGAKPIFNTDVFCFAHPASTHPQRPKLLPAKTIMDGVRKGVEDGGNKSGIPTVNGAIVFHDGYRAKPLVFCGTGGILPVNGRVGTKLVHAYKKHTQKGDAVVMVGGRVGKDGVHGATFSSESLNEGSPLSAVQIGDPFTQKRVLDFIIEARDAGLITGITDNGAGGLSSSVGEMARITGGASIDVANIPLKYAGLADWEIVVSESQERMTISTRDLEAVKKLAQKHSVEVTHIGEFHDRGHFEITRDGKPIAVLDLHFLHDGVPTLELESTSTPSQITMKIGRPPESLEAVLARLLAHPNICSREYVIRQYDHEVQGMSVVKPLMGARQLGPCDAAVIIPLYGDRAGLVVSNGLAPRLSVHDAYLMAIFSVDEAVRNAVCVGADPQTISLLDNFCWPDPVFSPSNPNGRAILGQLVLACQGLHEAVLAYQAPLISGKDSMKNNFDDGSVKLAIPPTLLVSAIARVPDASKCMTMEFKKPGDRIYLLSASIAGLASSHYEELQGWQSIILPSLDLPGAARLYDALFEAMQSGWVRSAHDVSDGGLAVALAECAIGSGLGATIDLTAYREHVTEKLGGASAELPAAHELMRRTDTLLFGEGPAQIVVTVACQFTSLWEGHMKGHTCLPLGEVVEKPRLAVRDCGADVLDTGIDEMEKWWRTALPFD